MSPSIVIAGGGVAGLEAALALRELLGPSPEIALVSAEPAFRYRALGVGEPFGLGAPARHAIAPIAHDLGLVLVEDAVGAVEPGARALRLASGARLPYDRLILATGAPSRPPSEHGVLFDRATNGPAFDAVLADLQAGLISSVAFAVPSCVSWPLPAYELALMTAAWGAAARPGGVDVSVLSRETSPLALFGHRASGAVADALRRGGVRFAGGAEPVLDSDVLVRMGGHQVRAERVVVLPEVVGPRIAGVPADRDGFVSVDADGRVPGAPGVFAVGDAAAHPVKHGGLAAQQAAAAARAIAAELGAEALPAPPRPILRGLLRTVDGPLYLRAALDDVQGTSTASPEPLWWPPSKLAAPRLTSYLGRIERARAEGRVLPGGGFARMAAAS